MYAVVSADGSVAVLPIEHQSIAAIQRHLMGIGEPLFPQAGRRLPSMRLNLLRILTMLPFLDQPVSAEKARTVDRAALALGVKDSGLIMLRQALRRQYRRITFSILHRSIRQFWSSDGKVRLRDWADMIFVMLPMLTPGRKQLNEKYQALGMRRPGAWATSSTAITGPTAFRCRANSKAFQGQFKLTHCPPLTGLESFAPLAVPAPVPHPLRVSAAAPA